MFTRPEPRRANTCAHLAEGARYGGCLVIVEETWLLCRVCWAGATHYTRWLHMVLQVEGMTDEPHPQRKDTP